MKKILLVAALVLGFAAAAVAQPRAIGLRGTLTGAEISYQHTLNANFIEADLGISSGALSLAGIYNFNLAQFGNGFNVYAGPGADLVAGKGVFMVGVAGQVGLEYNFDPHFNVPIQLSLDLRPHVLGITAVKGAGMGLAGPAGFWPFLGIRYAF